MATQLSTAVRTRANRGSAGCRPISVQLILDGSNGAFGRFGRHDYHPRITRQPHRTMASNSTASGKRSDIRPSYRTSAGQRAEGAARVSAIRVTCGMEREIHVMERDLEAPKPCFPRDGS